MNHNFFRIGIGAAIALAMGPGISPAQSPAERKAIGAFRDSLHNVRDTAALLRLETSTIALAKNRRDDAMTHLQLGFIALRLRELGSKKHLGYALSEFEWAVELQPDWPWPWLGIALTDKLSPNASRYGGGLFTLLGLDAESKAGQSFAKSISADSGFTEALIGLADVALHQRINSPVTIALDALRSATVKDHSLPMLLARGRLERVAGYPDSSLKIFDQARKENGPSPLLWLEIARTVPVASASFVDRLSLPRGDSAYYLGALSDDSAIVAMYRSDLVPVVEDSVLSGFDAAKGEARVTWLHTFWNERDQLDMRTKGSRLAEHFRRWDQVRREFPLTPFRRRYAAGLEDFQSGNSEVDDRGILLLRHGYPTQRIVWPISPRGPRDTLARNRELTTLGDTVRLGRSKFVQPAVRGNFGNETWIYRRPDGDITLHFAANFDPQDYRLQANGMGLDVAFFEILHTIYTTANMPSLRRLLESNGGNVDNNLAEERVRGRRDNTLATTTDSWFREYLHPLSGRPGWFAAGEQGGWPLMHLVYAVDANALSSQPWKQIPVTLRATFLDANGKVVATLDTTQVVKSPEKGITVIALRAEVRLPPTAQQVRMGAEVTPDRGVIHRTDTLRLPRVDGTQLDISSILIGRHNESLRWLSTPKDTAWLDPLMTYHLSDSLDVYAEMYGLTPGENYTVKLAMTRQKSGLGKLLGGADAAMSLTETVRYDERTGRFKRSISLSAIEAGDYQLEITIEGKNGRATTRRRVYVVK